MNDIALWLPALILPLFCLIYSAAARRETYFPLPKGISKKLRDPHTVFLAMLCVMVAAAALRIAESFGRTAFDGTGALNLIHTVGLVSLIVLFCLFALYICVLPIADRRGAAVLAAVAAAGVLVRSIWSAPRSCSTRTSRAPRSSSSSSISRGAFLPTRTS